MNILLLIKAGIIFSGVYYLFTMVAITDPVLRYVAICSLHISWWISIEVADDLNTGDLCSTPYVDIISQTWSQWSL